MDEGTGCSVRSLLPKKFENLPQLLKRKLAEDSAERRADFPGFAWKVLGSKATDALQSSLDCDVFEILARVWCKARELQEYSVDGKHPPAEETTVFLGSHKFSTQVYPTIVVILNSIEGPRLRFTLELAAEFRAAALFILDGHITGLGAGDCMVSAQLKYEDHDLHKKAETQSVQLTRPIKFKPPGLAISRKARVEN